MSVQNISIFGREPAAIIAIVGSTLTFLAALNVPFLNAGAAAAITALISAGILAWTTRPLAPALLTGVFTALVAVVAEYGFSVSDEVVGGVSAVILALFAFITREQVSPQDTSLLTHS
jgi:hypothetical protein